MICGGRSYHFPVSSPPIKVRSLEAELASCAEAIFTSQAYYNIRIDIIAYLEASASKDFSSKEQEKVLLFDMSLYIGEGGGVK